MKKEYIETVIKRIRLDEVVNVSHPQAEAVYELEKEKIEDLLRQAYEQGATDTTEIIRDKLLTLEQTAIKKEDGTYYVYAAQINRLIGEIKEQKRQ